MITEELKKILDAVSSDFYGTIEISYQAGHPGVVRTTHTQRLSDNNSSSSSSRNDRGHNGYQSR